MQISFSKFIVAAVLSAAIATQALTIDTRDADANVNPAINNTLSLLGPDFKFGNGTELTEGAFEPDSGCSLWIGNVFQRTGCDDDGPMFSRCVGSSVGCVRLDNVIGFAQSVQIGIASCRAFFYSDTACTTGQVTLPLTSNGEIPTHTCIGLGGQKRSYRIQC